ncbi:hypothetical protein DPMN_073426 [Dreissena polymorpha]|uniref:Uncharacterized protein n=1 Tax=Dreissena polymorpha TaxID=45954 RepID=A0A9D4BZ57_DREPO|nr:hypothetical protein DPMN_073426 [Dreissena polymorpha]
MAAVKIISVQQDGLVITAVQVVPKGFMELIALRSVTVSMAAYVIMDLATVLTISVMQAGQYNLCADGWIIKNCSIACEPGYYGENCSMDCHCDLCHNVNGSCALYSTQCRAGLRLEGELCTPKEETAVRYGEQYDSYKSIITQIR